LDPSAPGTDTTTAGDGGATKETGAKQLAPQHIEYLRARAVPLDVALKAGLRSVSAEEAGRLLERKGPAPGPGLAIPYLDISPPQWRIRLDNPADGARYLCEARREVPVYIPSVLPEDDRPTIVVESPVKALALAAAGFRAIALGGTPTTLTKDEDPRRLNDTWKRLPVKDRPFVVLFDSDRGTNPSVARDEGVLAHALELAGANVTIAPLPPNPSGEPWGPDDFLAARGTQALKEVVENAYPADPVVRARSISPESAADLLDDLPFLLAAKKRSSACTKRVRDALKAVGKISVKDFDAALAIAKRKLRNADGSESARGQLGEQYVIQDGAICRMETQFVAGDLERVAVPLCNFAAEIERETISDDGVTETRLFELTGRTEDGKGFATIEVTPDDLRNEQWAMKHWGAGAIVGPIPGTASHLRTAIQTMSNPEIVRQYVHTGWRELDDKFVFLHAGGAIGAFGIKTKLSERLGNYILPDDPSNLVEAVTLSLRFLDGAPWRITLPLFAAVYRAPIQSFLACDSTIWVCGHTGALKSSLTAAASAHFGRFDHNTLPAGWHDTAAHIEYTMFLAKDVLLVIDDFAPNGAEGWEEVHRKAAYVLRSIGNQASRGRMRADLSERAARPPRALVMVTGEDLPNGQSILARILPVHLEPGDVNTRILSELQAKQGRLPHAMSGYIQWLRPQLDGIGARLRERFIAWRSEFQDGQAHLRTPETLAHLMIGIEFFSKFAVEVGVFSEQQAGHFRDQAVAEFRQLGDAQSNTVVQEDPAQKFVWYLRTLIAQGKVEIVENVKEKLIQIGGSQQIGWRDGEAAYLLPEATYAAVFSAMRTAGTQFPLKESTLWSRLRDAGVLKPGDPGHATCKKTCGGGRPRVIVMSLTALELDGPDDDPKEGAPVPPVSDDGERRAENPGQKGEESGRETAGSGHGGGCGAGGGKEDQILTSSSTPPRPGAPTEKEGSCIDSSPPDASVQQTATDDPPVRDSLPGEDRGVGASPANRGELQENLRPRSEPAPHIVVGAQVAVPNYEVILQPAELEAVASAVDAAGEVSLDFETLGLDPLIHRPRLLQLGLPDGRVFLIDLFAVGSPGPVGEVIKSTQIIVHNLHFELKFLKHHFGIEPASGWDTMTAAKLLDKGQRRKKRYFALEAVCERELGVKLDKKLQTSDWSGELTEEQLAYAAKDAAVLWPLKKILAPALTAAGLDRVADLEFEVLAPVVDMELSGVGIDHNAWKSLFEERQALAETLKKCAAEALGVVNINSQPEVMMALKHLGIPATGTSAAALAPFSTRPEIRKFLDFKAAVTFPRNIGKHVMKALELNLHKDGRIHPNLNPLAAPTGRFGCDMPNLLGMPKERAVRQAVIPSPGYVFVDVDFTAIELRVLAQAAGDAGLIKLFKNHGDPHRRTAAAMLNVDESQVDKEGRQRAKPVNFGFVFGMGAKQFVVNALADYNLVFTLAEAMKFKTIYLHTYPGVALWQQKIRDQMPLEVKTPSGRTRLFSNRKEGYCQRLNTPIQGGAADGMKAALILLHQRLPPLGARLVLCIHDEVLVEAPTDRADEVKTVVEKAMIEGMESFITAVPIVVEARICSSWG
jgi:DNA polymerase I-like protein with 3'-5' exonuclease and polymerase domains